VYRDERNCGECGHECGTGLTCDGGTCIVECHEGLTKCDNFCRDVLRDRGNCGGCNQACASGEVCVAGACAATCPEGQTACDGTCADLQSDPAYCGACGTACAVEENEWPVCVAGKCDVACKSGFNDCDFDPANGCESEAATDASNCNGCGNVCGADLVCRKGKCRPECPKKDDGTCFEICDSSSYGAENNGGDASWVICDIDDDAETAWLSMGPNRNNGGIFSADYICQMLGYDRMTRWGGTSGNVCMSTSCENRTRPNYDHNNQQTNYADGDHGRRIYTTVEWECGND
jgi:hypothetical protein